MESWHILLHIATMLEWDAAQINIKMAFLYGVLPEDETQYMEQPKDFKEINKTDWVWELQQGLYGIKKSRKIWNKTMNKNMVKWGFTQLQCESYIYYWKSTTGTIITAIHVDNFLSIAETKEENHRFKQQMKKIWTITDLGLPHFIVSITVKWENKN